MATVTAMKDHPSKRDVPPRDTPPPPPPPGPDHPRPDWKRFLRVNKDGLFLGDVLNVTLALKFAPEWSCLIGFDEAWKAVVALRDAPYASEQPPRWWTSEDDTLLQCWLLHNGFASISVQTIERAVAAVAKGHPFHRVRDYLNSVTWDGISRID